jgi:hypothetical protein
MRRLSKTICSNKKKVSQEGSGDPRARARPNRTYNFVLQERDLRKEMPCPLAKRIFVTTSTNASKDRFCFVRFCKQEGPQQVDWLCVLIVWLIGIEKPPNFFTYFRLYTKE